MTATPEKSLDEMLKIYNFNLIKYPEALKLLAVIERCREQRNENIEQRLLAMHLGQNEQYEKHLAKWLNSEDKELLEILTNEKEK